MPFTVHLRDSGFEEEYRSAAEARYRAKLERALGGEEKVEETFSRWDARAESPSTPSNADKALGKMWQDTVRDAMAAGFKGMALPEGFEGYFEIRLAR